MPEALWLQVAGVDYSASEDRRLIKALSTAGVVEGLVITATSGTGISVSAGTAVIDTGSGEGYIAYTTAPTNLTLPVSSTTNVFIKVDTATALVTVGQGTLPTAGTYLLLASIATSASAVTTAMPVTPATRALPVNVAGKYLQLSGGVVTGEVQASRLLVSGKFGVGGVDAVPNAPLGVRLGGTYAQARHHFNSTLSPSPANVINNSATVWEKLYWVAQTQGGTRNYTDYSNYPFNPATNYAMFPGVPGTYLVTGYVNWTGRTGGSRNIRLEVWDRNGGATNTISYWTNVHEYLPVNANDVMAPFSAMITMGSGDDQYCQLTAKQDSGVGLSVQTGRVYFNLLAAR